MKKSNITHKLAAAATMAMVTMSGTASFAATFSDVTKNVTAASDGVPKAFGFASYLAGGVFAIAGIAELKKHGENPSQTAMKGGLSKLVGGGALLALPTITEAMQGSVSTAGSTGADTTAMTLEDTTAFQ